MITLEEISNALGIHEKTERTDSHAYGEVKEINNDGSYQVSLNGSDTTVRCAKLTGAKVGDTVLVTILKNGYAVVTGCVGGDTDAADAAEAAEIALKSIVLEKGRIDNLSGELSTYKQYVGEKFTGVEGNFTKISGDLSTYKEYVGEKFTGIEASFSNLDTDYVRTNKANIDTAWIEDLLVKGKFLADTVHAGSGYYSKDLVGVNVAGDIIVGNTVKADALILQGADGIYRRLNIDALGQAVVDADPKYNEKFDGSILVANSVTAREIDVYDLFAQNITARGTMTGMTIIGGRIIGDNGRIGAFELTPSGLVSRFSGVSTYDWGGSNASDLKTARLDDCYGIFTDWYDIRSLSSVEFSLPKLITIDNFPDMGCGENRVVYDIRGFELRLEILYCTTPNGTGNVMHSSRIVSETVDSINFANQAINGDYLYVAFAFSMNVKGFRKLDTQSDSSGVFGEYKIIWGAHDKYLNYDYTSKLLWTTLKPRIRINGIAKDVSINPYFLNYGAFRVNNLGEAWSETPNNGDNSKRIATTEFVNNYMKSSSGNTDTHYTHVQNEASDIWEVTHGLGKEPAVTVVDSAGTEVVGDCYYIDTNKVRLTFASPFAGKAYFN